MVSTYNEGAFVRGKGMTLLQDLARKLFDEHRFFFRFEGL